VYVLTHANKHVDLYTSICMCIFDFDAYVTKVRSMYIVSKIVKILSRVGGMRDENNGF
jgi:hypothetical protein